MVAPAQLRTKQGEMSEGQRGRASEATAGDVRGRAGLPPPKYVRNKGEMSEGQRGHLPAAKPPSSRGKPGSREAGRQGHARTASNADHPSRSRKPPHRKPRFTDSPPGEHQEGVQRSDGINAADHQLSISQSSKMTARVSPNKNNRPRKALANSPFTVTSSPMSTDAILRLVVNLHSTYRSSANVNGGST